MSDKERLEEIKNGCLEGLHILFGTSWVSMPKENFNWLIEQAEKAEKYREALEFYADKEIYEPVLISEAQCIDGNWVEPAFYEPPTIYFDKGEIAREALESDEN